MNEETKEQIAEILMAWYKIPGQYFITFLILLEFGETILKLTNWAYIILILSIFFLILEIISPFIAGVKLYNKAIKSIKNLFR